MIGREDEVREYRERAWMFMICVLCGWSFILMRLVYLQVIKGSELRQFSETNRLKKEKLFPPRGIIFDRNGKVIVDNKASFDVVLLPQYYVAGLKRAQLKDLKTNLHARNVRLAKALEMKLEDVEERVAKIPYSPKYLPILLKSDVSKENIAAIETDAEGFPGIDIEANVQRRYPFGDVAAQILGYISEVDQGDIKNFPLKKLQPGDYIGKIGLEKLYDTDLRGENGFGYVEVDARGRRQRTEGGERLLSFVAQTEPVPGNNIHLTIDMDLELAASQSLKSHKYNGAVVAIDPRSGEVLAMVSEPSFDPGRISGREIGGNTWRELSEGKDKPLLNRAMQGIYPPGSTFKLFMAIAALAEKTVDRNYSVNCTGSFPFGNRRFSCWKRHGTGEIIKSIKESCDVYYYSVGHKIGINPIADYARRFGLGKKTEMGKWLDPKGGKQEGYGLFPEASGLIPDEAWKRATYNQPWHPGETISVSIGQGYVSATPIQMANAYAAIGNGGFLYRPFLVKRIEQRDGNVIQEFRPELRWKIDAPADVFETVKKGLFEVVNSPGGTAFFAGRSKLVEISGKTGTAQVRGFADIMKMKCENMPIKDRHHGWFVAYAPRENPEIAVAVLSEHACHGTSSAPIVRDVIEAYMKKKLPPEQIEMHETASPAAPVIPMGDEEEE